MIVGANQVTFLPWVGYWNRLVSVDTYIDMLDTQYEKGDYYNRVKVGGSWMTLPVFTTVGMSFDQVRFDIAVLPKMIKRIQQTYSKAPYRYRLGPLLVYFEECSSDSLLEFNFRCRNILATIMGIDLHHVTPSIEVGGATTNERLWNMLKATVPSMSQYFSGAGGLKYLEHSQVPVKIQQVVHAYDGESILKLIVNEDNPYEAIIQSCVWVLHEDFV